jgi:hypothetical protein
MWGRERMMRMMRTSRGLSAWCRSRGDCPDCKIGSERRFTAWPSRPPASLARLAKSVRRGGWSWGMTGGSSSVRGTRRLSTIPAGWTGGPHQIPGRLASTRGRRAGWAR